MMKVYVVKSRSGEGDDYKETLEIAFTDIKDAKAYVEDVQDYEEEARSRAEMCRNCDGFNNNCQLYQEPFYLDDPCENYYPHHENVDFYIDEVKLVEKKHGKTV